jgi:hypothetical protein
MASTQDSNLSSQQQMEQLLRESIKKKEDE